jgi:sugar phosphate permease
MTTKVVLSSFIRAWFIYQHRAVFGKLQGTSLPVNCRIIFNWIPEEESAEVSSTFMWANSINMVMKIWVLTKMKLDWLSLTVPRLRRPGASAPRPLHALMA